MDKVEDKTEVTKNGLDFDEPRIKFRGLDHQGVSESDLALWEQSPPVAEIPSERSSETNKSNWRSVCDKLSQVFAICAVVLALIGIWFLFAVPQLCYFEVGLCVQEGSEDVSETLLPSQNCTAVPYTGSLCLNNFGSCPNPLLNKPENGSESNILTLFTLLDTITLSSTCEPEKDAIKQFVCTYVYQPCDIDNNAILPARNVCEYLRDTACSDEWLIIVNGQFSSLLPVCGELPPEVTAEPSCDFKNISYNSNTSAISDDDDDDPASNNTATNTTTGSCGGVVYSSNDPPICSNYLIPCLVDSFVESTRTTLGILFGLFSSLANDQSCKNEQTMVEEFLCQSLFPRCDSNLVTHLPNRSHCEYIRDTLCPNDWISIGPFANGLLPNCSLLPETSSDPMCVEAVPTSQTNSSTEPTTNPGPSSTVDSISTNITLHCNEEEGFYLYITEDNSTINNTCQARCSKWNQFDSQIFVTLDDVFILLATIVGVIGSIAVIFFSIIRRERMLVFPSIFLVYSNIYVFVFGVVLLIQFTDRESLSCASNDLVVTTGNHPTVFCQIAGFTFLLALFGLTYWWFAHICAIFWKIMFPFHAKANEENGKYIHAVVLILGIILPLVTPSLAFVWDGYRNSRYPPLLCLPTNSNVTFFGTLIPLTLAISIGISQLILVLYVVHKKSRLFKYRVSKTHKFGLSTAEKKLLFVFIYYLLVGYVDIVAFTLGIARVDQYAKQIESQFTCEALRVDPDYDCPGSFNDFHIVNSFTILAYILLGLYPAINLVFAVNKSEVRVKLVTWFPSVFTESYRKSTLSTSVITVPDTPFTMRRRLTYQISTADKDRSRELGTIGRSGVYTMQKSNSTVGV